MTTKELIQEIFKEIFVLIVRLLSLVLFCLGVLSLAAHPLPTTPLWLEAIIPAAIYFAAAFWLFRGPVIGWAYPEAAASGSQASDTVTSSAQKPDAQSGRRAD